MKSPIPGVIYERKSWRLSIPGPVEEDIERFASRVRFRTCVRNVVVYQFRGAGRLRGDRKGDVIGVHGRGDQEIRSSAKGFT